MAQMFPGRTDHQGQALETNASGSSCLLEIKRKTAHGQEPALSAEQFFSFRTSYQKWFTHAWKQSMQIVFRNPLKLQLPLLLDDS